jgi:hypothetical protein
MTAALLVKSVVEKEARERMIDAHTAKEILPELNGQTRDKNGELAGVSCPVCSHTHRNMIEVLLLESPHPLKRISMFYEIDLDDLKYHRTVCMRRN